MSDIALFFSAAGMGGAIGILYLPLSFLRKSGGIAGTVLVDVFTGILLFAPLVLLAYLYTDGEIAFYTVVALALGFFAFKTPLTAVLRRIARKRRKRRAEKVDEKGKNKV